MTNNETLQKILIITENLKQENIELKSVIKNQNDQLTILVERTRRNWFVLLISQHPKAAALIAILVLGFLTDDYSFMYTVIAKIFNLPLPTDCSI